VNLRIFIPRTFIFSLVILVDSTSALELLSDKEPVLIHFQANIYSSNKASIFRDVLFLAVLTAIPGYFRIKSVPDILAFNFPDITDELEELPFRSKGNQIILLSLNNEL
jgi:hypothetical protein